MQLLLHVLYRLHINLYNDMAWNVTKDMLALFYHQNVVLIQSWHVFLFNGHMHIRYNIATLYKLM